VRLKRRRGSAFSIAILLIRFLPPASAGVALTFAEPVAPDAGFSRKLEYPASGVA
jgi:hypothetical protein